MNNKPKKYTSTLIVRTNPELKHAFTTAQAINKDKFTEFIIKACDKFISKYSTIDHVMHDDDVIHDEIKVNQNNDHVLRDEHVIHDDHVLHDEDVLHDDGVVHDDGVLRDEDIKVNAALDRLRTEILSPEEIDKRAAECLEGLFND